MSNTPNKSTADSQEGKYVTVPLGLSMLVAGGRGVPLQARITSYLMMFQLEGMAATPKMVRDFFRTCGEKPDTIQKTVCRLVANGQVKKSGSKLTVPSDSLPVNDTAVKLLYKQMNPSTMSKVRKPTNEVTLLKKTEQRNQSVLSTIQTVLPKDTFLWAKEIGLFENTTQWNISIPAMIPKVVLDRYKTVITARGMPQLVVGTCVVIVHELVKAGRAPSNPGAYITSVVKNLDDNKHTNTLDAIDRMLDGVEDWNPAHVWESMGSDIHSVDGDLDAMLDDELGEN